MTAVYAQGQKLTLRRTVMGGKKVLTGFDYRLQKQVGKTRAEWRDELKALVSHGGHRRHEHGETFGHAKGGLIAFEIYDNVSL